MPGRIGHGDTQRHLEEQLHQLSSKVETGLFPMCLHPVIRMRRLDPDSRSRENNRGIRSHVLQETPAHLINRARDE